jgi:hypothetical protein
MSNTPLANAHYQFNQKAHDRQSSARDAQIPIPDTAKIVRRTPDETEKLDPCKMFRIFLTYSILTKK